MNLIQTLSRISIALLAVILLACQPGSKDSVRQDDFSSPKNLFVDHVHSVTSGIISATSNVKLRLTKAVADSLVGTSLTNVFSFSPSIKGTTSWEDNRTVVFQPGTRLPNDQKYEITANLESIVPGIDKDKREFKFVFQTLVQNYEVVVGGLKLYDNSDLTRIKIEGLVQTADVATLEDIKKIIQASQSDKGLKISWETSSQTNAYSFAVEDVTRDDEAGEVKLEMNGASIGVDKTQILDVEVPALDDYKVVSSSIVSSGENYISVLFSDPLDNKQNLVGLVTLSGTSGNPRVVVNLNELKIYPTRTISGSATITVNNAVRNAAGYKLKADYKTTLQFTQIKPQVRLINADNKAILPNSKGLVLPFEAAGLRAVDVTVVRIFEDNMLQYLQVNGLGGQSQLNRVGRPVVRKVVPLNASGVTNLNSWNRFTLNLQDILKTEPGAFYQIQIGFRKQHSLYFCVGNGQTESLEEELDEWGPDEEDSNWDSYEYYYNPNYNWQERDNPCSDSYYGRRRSVSKMLFASDLGIIAKRRDGGDLSVFVTNLVSTVPIGGVDVSVFDYQQQLLSIAKTDESGKVNIELEGKPFVLIAKKAEQTGYLKLDDGSSLSLSNFDITGNKVQRGLKGFVYGERGVWRPADTVHLGFVLEDAQKTLPVQHPVVMELFNPDGQLTFRQVSSEPVGNIFRFDFKTEEDAPTGNWQAVAKVGGAKFYKQVKIETIKPNRLKINLDFGVDKFTAKSRNVSADLNVRWLSGAKASNLKAEYELMFKRVKTTFDGYGNYSFDDLSKNFYSSREMVYQGRVDADGNGRVNIDLGEVDDAPGALQANLYGKVYEEGGDFSISNASIPYYPYSSFVGVLAPEGDRRGILLTDKGHEIRIATVDAEGNPISLSGIRVELFKISWRWWWDRSYDNFSNYVGRSNNEVVNSGTVSTTNGQGSWTMKVDYPNWGRYYLRVTDPVSGHSAGRVVYIDWPGWAGKGKRGELDGATMLDFGVEKDEYKIGEDIALSIPTTAGNRILVSLETGSEVLQTFWVETEEGNTSISFEATPDMAPNIYAHLTMVQPHGQTGNDLPIRLYGVQSIKVVDPKTKLEPVITLPSELSPEQEYTIEVSEKSGQPMAYTVAVVDEGLLDITNFKTPEPWGSFYAREALGVKTWDVYDDVMGAFAGQMNNLLAIGGDDELKPKEENESNRFKPVVMFLGPFEIGAGETGEHKVKMPQYIGSVKTMVVAANEGAYGSADVATPVKQPLMLLATLPRVAGPGESMKLPVNVFASQDDIKDVKIQVEVTGALELSGNKTANIRFSGAGDQLVTFDITAKQLVGAAKVKVTAKSGSMEANYDINMMVIPRNPVTTDVAEKIVEEGADWSIDYTAIGLPGENTASIEVSALPPLNIEQRLGYLIRYPHGCIEQTTSAVFPQLFLDKLISLDEQKKGELQHNIEAAIKRLKSFQLSSGGFSYWPGNSYANNWGSNYAGHFLVEARLAGYAVPEGMLANWISFQNSKAEAWGSLSTDEDNDHIQAYRLYSLAKAGEPTLGAMNRMKENTNISASAKWRLALAYAVAGFDQQAQNLIEGLSVDPGNEEGYYRYSYGSYTRNQAMLLETLLELGKKEEAFGVLKSIAEKMGDRNLWMSTQTTAYCFISIAKYASNFNVDDELSIEVADAGDSETYSSTDYLQQVSVKNPDKAGKLTVKNNGESPVFVRLIRSGIPIEGAEEKITRNINFSMKYLDLDGNSVNVNALPQGTNFKAEVTVTNPGLKGIYTDLALTQIFPAGWEIINTRLDGSDAAASDANYVDIRDDRAMHYFDLAPNKTAKFTVLLNASYLGKFYLPSVSVEAMYDNAIFANQPGKWVQVVPE